MNHNLQKSSLILMVTLLFFSSCSGLSLKKKIPKKDNYRLGVIGFNISAPIKKLKDIKNLEDKKEINDVSVKDEIKGREEDAKEYFLHYMQRYNEIVTVPIPNEKVKIKKGLKISRHDLKALKEEYNLDALILGEVPWYGKTNIMYPITGIAADTLGETIIIGLVTKWNWTLILGNVGFNLLTSTPLWFGGSYLFGRAFKPVTLETKLYTFGEKFEEVEETYETASARHMLNKYPQEDRKKKEYQLEASFRKVLKEVAVDLGGK